MGDELYNCVEAAVAQYTKQTADTNIASMKFDVQLASDGYGIAYLPSEVTHRKAAEKLIVQIQKLMGWQLLCNSYNKSGV